MHSLEEKERSKTEAQIEEVFQHENYDKSDHDNDIMLLKVESRMLCCNTTILRCTQWGNPIK